MSKDHQPLVSSLFVFEGIHIPSEGRWTDAVLFEPIGPAQDPGPVHHNLSLPSWMAFKGKGSRLTRGRRNPQDRRAIGARENVVCVLGWPANALR